MKLVCQRKSNSEIAIAIAPLKTKDIRYTGRL
jgi:hypothetical protein